MTEHLKPHVAGTNGAGRTFNVVALLQGEHYGRNDCLTHDKAEPLVEFYDATLTDEDFGSMGRFVSRYYMSTLLGLGGFSRQREPGVGIDLCGHVPSWRVSYDNVTDALNFVWGRLMASVSEANDKRDSEDVVGSDGGAS
jgi:hypothetical protein